MIRYFAAQLLRDGRLPRMRGDDPTNKLIGLGADLFAPACAGMIRCRYPRCLSRVRLPRMRGDDPYLPLKSPPAPLFAPHARG